MSICVEFNFFLVLSFSFLERASSILRFFMYHTMFIYSFANHFFACNSVKNDYRLFLGFFDLVFWILSLLFFVHSLWLFVWHFFTVLLVMFIFICCTYSIRLHASTITTKEELNILWCFLFQKNYSQNRTVKSTYKCESNVEFLCREKKPTQKIKEKNTATKREKWNKKKDCRIFLADGQFSFVLILI